MEKVGTLSYCELRAKEVVNVIDGRRLGRVIDIVFTAGHDCAEVRGIVVPYVRRLFFSRSQEVFVPWQCIRKIGEDVILIDLVLEGGHGGHDGHGGKKRRRYDAFEDGHFDDCDDGGKHGGHGGHGGQNSFYSVHTDSVKGSEKKEESPKPDAPTCDHKCEKCMLFDCAYRWKDV